MYAKMNEIFRIFEPGPRRSIGKCRIKGSVVGITLGERQCTKFWRKSRQNNDIWIQFWSYLCWLSCLVRTVKKWVKLDNFTKIVTIVTTVTNAFTSDLFQQSISMSGGPYCMKSTAKKRDAIKAAYDVGKLFNADVKNVDQLLHLLKSASARDLVVKAEKITTVRIPVYFI